MQVCVLLCVCFVVGLETRFPSPDQASGQFYGIWGLLHCRYVTLLHTVSLRTAIQIHLPDRKMHPEKVSWEAFVQICHKPVCTLCREWLSGVL